jgi:hypothetical protein
MAVAARYPEWTHANRPVSIDHGSPEDWRCSPGCRTERVEIVG